MRTTKSRWTRIRAFFYRGKKRRVRLQLAIVENSSPIYLKSLAKPFDSKRFVFLLTRGEISINGCLHFLRAGELTRASYMLLVLISCHNMQIVAGMGFEPTTFGT